MSAISVMYPAMPADIGEVLPYARVAENTTGRRLWLGQSLGIETHAVFAALSGMGLDIGFGSAVTLMPLRHPLTAAANGRSIAALSGHPYIAGVGPGGKELQRRVNGRPYDKPVTASRHYLDMMRTLTEGGHHRDETGPWPTEGLDLPPMDTPPVELGLGVLREPMAGLAGEAADWALTWLTPVDYIRDRLIPAMATAAQRADRPAPRVASLVHCAVDRPRRDLKSVALQAVGAHLRTDHYTDMLCRSGIPVDPADPDTGAEMIIKRNVFATGTPEEIAETLCSYHEAGVDEVVVNVCGVHMQEGPGSALRDLSAVLAAVDRRGER